MTDIPAPESGRLIRPSHLLFDTSSVADYWDATNPADKSRVCVRRDTHAAFMEHDYIYAEFIYVTDLNILLIGNGIIPYSRLAPARSVMDVVLAANFVLRRDTTAGWKAINPVLREGELGLDTDKMILKAGNAAGDAWLDRQPIKFEFDMVFYARVR